MEIYIYTADFTFPVFVNSVCFSNENDFHKYSSQK